jgi:hypothetical protein
MIHPSLNDRDLNDESRRERLRAKVLRNKPRTFITNPLDHQELPWASAPGASLETGEMIYRTLGRQARKFPPLAWADFILVCPNEQEGIGIIRSAIDRGITFAGQLLGLSQRRQRSSHGKALRDGTRDRADSDDEN